MDHVIRCSKCSYYADFFEAPKGKVIRNVEALKYGCTYDDCNACNGTGIVPKNIMNSIKEVFPLKYESIYAMLRWNGDHWGFMHGHVYVGVETDGRIHT